MDTLIKTVEALKEVRKRIEKLHPITTDDNIVAIVECRVANEAATEVSRYIIEILMKDTSNERN